MRLSIVLILAVLFASGCARMVVTKDPGPRDTGVRFYRPKPYLFIGPGGAPEAKPGAGAGAGKSATIEEMQAEVKRLAKAVQENQANQPVANKQFDELQETVDALGKRISEVEGKLQQPTTQPVIIRLEYLPDYSEEYSIRVTPGLGSAKLQAQLQNGWNLTSVNVETDQQYDEIIGSVAQLVGAAGKLGAGGMSITEATAESNVPMGYYEAVIGHDACGRKQMMGWRYVGFMPCNTCPVESHVYPGEAICDDEHVYALSIVGGVLQFKKMREIKSRLNCPDCDFAEQVMEPVEPRPGSPR